MRLPVWRRLNDWESVIWVNDVAWNRRDWGVGAACIRSGFGLKEEVRLDQNTIGGGVDGSLGEGVRVSQMLFSFKEDELQIRSRWEEDGGLARLGALAGLDSRNRSGNDFVGSLLGSELGLNSDGLSQLKSDVGHWLGASAVIDLDNSVGLVRRAVGVLFKASLDSDVTVALAAAANDFGISGFVDALDHFSHWLSDDESVLVL